MYVYLDPSIINKGITAKQWIEYCLTVTNSLETGKAGGKADQANGSVSVLIGNEKEFIELLVNHALSFANTNF